VNIVGISAFYHEAACCLLVDGRLVAAAQEERFSRVKHDARLPVLAFRFCLEQAGIGIGDIDCLAYYEQPVAKLARQLWAGPPAGAHPDFAWLDPQRPIEALRRGLGYEGRILTFPHHASHAASAFFYSGFSEAAVLTVDGVGEWATATYGHGRGKRIEPLDEVSFPHSLGLLYSAITSYLGFAVNDGEYKVMGLAPYGEPRFLPEMRRLVFRPGDGRGRFALDLGRLDFLRGSRMYGQGLIDLFGHPPRRPGEEIESFHQDVARSLQVAFEEILLEEVRYLHEKVPVPDLCLAGGVALNCVANGRILREGPFSRLFVPPAPGDAGGCLGAAALAHVQETGEPPAVGPLASDFWGPEASADEIAVILSACELPAVDFRGRLDAMLEAVVDRLERREVVGWFQGAMEMGPRALGGRSLLADPRDPEARERLNRLVKKREAFRPFAPSVLAGHAGEHFVLDHPSPFMLETCQVRSPLELPAITHVDGSARPQTVDPGTAPRFAALLAAFGRRTGCPLLVNTSFNVAGEPIVCSPVDALLSFAISGVDALVLGDFVVDRADLPADLPRLIPVFQGRLKSAFGSERSALREMLYTFV
jgi:carbamoyltransferase